ncbi:MAG: hypothetical protein J5I47_04685 [Vicingus serpentipes]|nr:hypothetical protein [Vicingus serpentipes]
MAGIERFVQNDGDTVEWPMDVRHNTSTKDCMNAKLTFNIPSGVRIIGPTDPGSTVIKVPQGYYNITEKVWYIGTLKASQVIPVSFTVIVDDITLVDVNDGRFTLTATLTSSCVEVNTANNVHILAISIEDPCTKISITIGASDGEATCSNISIG